MKKKLDHTGAETHGNEAEAKRQEQSGPESDPITLKKICKKFFPIKKNYYFFVMKQTSIRVPLIY